MFKLLRRVLNSITAQVAIAASACLFMYFVPMKWGACVMGADSLSYITAARELVGGRGLYILDGMGGFTPLVHWPPGFPLMLAALSFVGVAPDEAAGLLNSILLAANALAVAYLLRMYGPKATWLPSLGMLAFLGSTTVLKIHADAMSEPLFIFCLLTTFGLIVKYHETNARAALVLAGVCAGWGLLTRYVGVTLIFTGMAAILFSSKGRLKTLIFDISLFVGIASLPMSLWCLRNYLLAAKPTSRGIMWHPPDYGHWLSLKETLSNWLMPSSSPTAIKLVAAFLAFVFIAAALMYWIVQSRASFFANPRSSRSRALLSILILFSLCYSLFLLFSICFVDLIQYPDERLTFPVYLSGLIILMIVIGDIWLKNKHGLIGGLLLTALCIFITLSIGRSSAWAYVVSREGWGGYNQPERCHSQTIAFLRRESDIDFSKLISNDCGAIYFWTSKSTVEIPRMHYTFYREVPPGAKVGDKRIDFEKNWSRLSTHILPGSFLIYFSSPMASGALLFPSEEELRSRLQLRLQTTFADGAIYALP